MPPVEIVVDLLLKLLLPALLSGALVMGLAVWRLERKWWETAAATALAVGILVGNSLRLPLSYWPEGWGWYGLLAISLGAVLIAFATRFIAQPIARLTIASLLLAALATCLLDGALRTWPWFIGLAVVVVGNYLALELIAAKQPGAWLPLAWTVLLGKAAVIVLVCSHSARLADIAMLLFAAQLGVIVAGVKLPTLGSVLAPLTATVLPGLMLAGWDATFSAVPLISFALVAVAPLIVAVMYLPAPWRQVALLFLLAATATALAIHAEGWPSF